MYPIGTKIQSQGGVAGTIVGVFADGLWAKKFTDCPLCDRPTWQVSIHEVNFTEDSGPHYLVVDAEGRWHMVDDHVTSAARVGSYTAVGEFKIGGTD